MFELRKKQKNQILIIIINITNFSIKKTRKKIIITLIKSYIITIIKKITMLGIALNFQKTSVYFSNFYTSN